MARRDWSSSAFIGGGSSFVVVRKRRKDGTWTPWHMPNGKKDPEKDEDALCTVIRETHEETGIIVLPHQVRKICWEKRKIRKRIGKRLRDHRYTQVFYRVFGHENEYGPLHPLDHDHEARTMTYEEYRVTTDFSEADRALIDKHGLIKGIQH